MKSITCPNPECAREHGLFWKVSSDKKRVLSYRCDRVIKKRKLKGLVDGEGNQRFELKRTTAVLPAPETVVADEGLPEEWTKAYKLKQQGKKQNQFILMNK